MPSTAASTINDATKLSRPIWIVGLLLGLFLSWMVLSGDDAGRVNLLYLLLVYLFIPLVGAIISVVSLLQGKGLNVARVLSAIPLQSKPFQMYLHKLRQMHLDKQWFFLQTQAAALAYACGSLIIFVVLLLATDINFVWRSTLLDAEQLQPLLAFIAAPWWFWDSAQPSVELLRITQDSRLNESYNNVSNFGQWWAFVLATQVLYSGVLRGVLLLIAKVWIKKTSQKNAQAKPQNTHVNVESVPATVQKLSHILHDLPTEYALTNWARISDLVVSQLMLNPTHSLPAGPIILEQGDAGFQGTQILLVKAWEPPMGELQDYMEHTSGIIFPVNYKHNKVTAPEPMHIEEWQRFTAQLPNWGIYQNKALALGEPNVAN